MKKGLASALTIVAVLVLLTTAASALVDPPLTTADIIRFLEAGISERTVLIELKDRGFWAPLDAPSEVFLKNAGASDTLIAAIRRAAPSPSAPPRPTGGAPAGTTIGPPPQGPSFAAATKTVRVPVSVLDQYGRPVTGLLAADFRIAENNRRQPITLFNSGRQPMRIALALDVSGSMANKIDQVEDALKYFIEILDPQDEIMVLTFSRRVHILQEFTSDRDSLERVLTALEPSGGTALYDAAYEAIQRVAKAPAESKAVVLVTDGVNTDSVTTFDDLLTLAQKQEVPVFSIGLDSGGAPTTMGLPGPPGGGGPGRPRGGGGGGGWRMPGGGVRPPARGGGRNGFDAKPLQELADETGGRAEILSGLEHYTPGEDSPRGERLRKAVESIALTLRLSYLIGYEPPEGKPGWRKIRIDVERPEGATTRARKGYFAEK
jgi:VWFA-related protein